MSAEFPLNLQPILYFYYFYLGQSHWPRGLRCGSAAARLVGLLFRTQPGAWISVCCDCCVLSGRGFCNEPITYPEESYRAWWVVVCDLETSWMRTPWPTLDHSATGKGMCICYTRRQILFNDIYFCRSSYLMTSKAEIFVKFKTENIWVYWELTCMFLCFLFFFSNSFN